MAANYGAKFMAGDGCSTSNPRAYAANPFTIEYRPLAGAQVGIFQTLDAMRDAVLGAIPPDFSGYQDAYNQCAAAEICAGARGAACLSALFHFVANSIEYKPHPHERQWLQDCRRTLEIGAGDCVSKSVCFATLSACLGFKPRFVAQNDGGEFLHVYVEVLTPEGWAPFDPVANDEPQGWTQPLPDGGFETPWEIFY